MNLFNQLVIVICDPNLTLIKLPNLQISYKGKTNTHSHSKELYLFINYELHAILNDLN